MRKMIHVVGNKFSNFASHEKVYTFSEFVTFANEHNISNTKIILGQGLNEYEKTMLKSLYVYGKVHYIDGLEINPASQTHTHKKNINNVLISDPVEHNKPNLYIAHLLINDDCAEMSDHVTGQHIQGVICIEAARQMMLATSEKFLLPKELADKSYCALLSVNTKFHRFAFPIKTDLLHSVKILKHSDTKVHAISKTSFLQNNILVSEVEIEYIFSDATYLQNRENQLAVSALDEANQSIS